jgi:hypothetical protein
MIEKKAALSHSTIEQQTIAKAKRVVDATLTRLVASGSLSPGSIQARDGDILYFDLVREVARVLREN